MIGAKGWATVAALAATVGCGPPTTEVAPAWPDGAVSAVAAVRGPQGLQIGAVEQGAFRLELTTSGRVQVFLLTYAVPLAELGLSEGPLALAEAGAPSVPLPAPRAVYEAGRDAPDELTPRDSVPADLLAVRIATRGPRACAEAGACFGARPGDEVLVCLDPCPPIEPPADPEPPAPARLTPCPTGWIEVPPATEDDVAECAPFPRSLSCDLGAMQIPGADACVRVGAACPDGAWPAQVADGEDTFYVRPGAPAGGDGTAGAPYDDVASVPWATGRRQVVVLGPGRYPRIDVGGDDVVIQGSCVTQTEVRAYTAPEGARIELRDLDLSALRLAFGRFVASGVRFGASSGLRVRAPLDATGCVFEGPGGLAVEAFEGAPLRIRGSRLNGGLLVRDAATASVSDTLVTGGGTGVHVTSGARVLAARVLVENSAENGAFVTGAGSALALEDAVFRAGPGREARLQARLEARIDARRLLVAGATSVGLVATGGDVEVRDGVVRDTKPDAETQDGGYPITVLEGGEGRLERVHVARGRTTGLLVRDADSVAHLTDVRVVEIAGELSRGGDAGHGVYVLNDARAEVERLQIQRAHGLGLLVKNSAWVEGSDLWVQDILPRDSNNAYGRGVEVGGAALFEMQRVRVEDAKNIGFHVLDLGSRANVFDLGVARTRRSECFEFSCNSGIADGVTVNLQASLELRRFRIEDCGQFGLRIINESPALLRDGVIRGNTVGAQVIDEGFDPTAIVTRVRYEDNLETLSFLAE